MRVQFHRTGKRQYSVTVLREGKEPLVKLSAPGFDDLLPHDMQHFIVELELGLRRAIFGQLAAGGTANTFHLATREAGRSLSRKERALRRKGRNLSAPGEEESSRSERATFVLWAQWLGTRKDEASKLKSRTMSETASAIVAGMSPGERALYSPANVQRVLKAMDEASAQWEQLRIGQFVELEWKQGRSEA